MSDETSPRQLKFSAYMTADGNHELEVPTIWWIYRANSENLEPRLKCLSFSRCSLS